MPGTASTPARSATREVECVTLAMVSTADDEQWTVAFASVFPASEVDEWSIEDQWTENGRDILLLVHTVAVV